MNKPTPATEVLPTLGAQRRLADSRAQIAQWLQHGGAAPAASSLMDCAVRGALPLLGTLAQAWLHSVQPRTARDSAMRPMDVALSLTRRHPTLILVTAATAGLALLWGWSRSSTRGPPR